MYTIHVLPNAHLDPVWLWDGREGLNQGIRSMRTTLNLMDEFPELTYMRGEAMLIVPGHRMPTEKPHRTQPISPKAGLLERPANR